jgi:hypothetical protein
LRWCENPSDHVAGFRVLQLLPGIGARTAEKILAALAHQTDLGRFTTVSARKRRTSRCLGLACDKQVKIGKRASRKSVLHQYEPAQADGSCHHLHRCTGRI